MPRRSHGGGAATRTAPFSFDGRAAVWSDRTATDSPISIESNRGDHRSTGFDHMTTGQARTLALALLAAVIEVEDHQAATKEEK